MLTSSTLLALFLASPEALATDRIVQVGRRKSSVARVTVTTSADEGSIGSVSAEVESEAGSESTTLTESDAWMHAVGAIKSLPKTTAKVSLTVSDKSGTALVVFTSTLDADGTIAADGWTPDTSKYDIEVLAAETFPSATGIEVGIDLNGADVYDLAIADLVITETASAQFENVALDCGPIGTVWQGDLALDHEGLVEIKTTTYDDAGTKLDSTKVTVGLPWLDGGVGQPALATDEDPLTSVSLLRRGQRGYHAGRSASYDLAVFSDGWTLGDVLPTAAEVRLDGGETLTVPANSYQVAALNTPYLKIELEAVVITHLSLTINKSGLTLDGATELSIEDLAAPVCANGTCFALTESESGMYEISVTAYALSATKLPASANVALVYYDKSGAKVGSDAFTAKFDDEVAVVFGAEVELAGDPVGVDLSGKVSLLGQASSKSKQQTLAKGKFYGTLGRDEDGDLGLAGADKDDVVSKGDILIGGEPIDFELTDTNKDGTIEAPPAVLLSTTGNGKGTRTATTASSGNPGLL